MKPAVVAATLISVLALGAGLAHAQGVRQGVEELGNKLIQNMPKDRELVVFVSDFPNLQGQTCELGRYISARLTTKLSQTPGVQVRERSRLNQVLDELAFNMQGLVDPSKAKEVGKLLGASALVLGEISDLGTLVEVDARIVELETGNSLPGTLASISKDSVVSELAQRNCIAPTGLASGSAPSVPHTASAAPAPPPSAAEPVEVAGLIFQFQSCTGSGGGLTCEAVVTSKDRDSQVRAHRNSSRIIDIMGHEYAAQRVVLGSKEGKSVDGTLVQGIPTRIGLQFSDVPKEVDMLALFEIGGVNFTGGGGGIKFRAQLRNVSVAQ